MEQRSDLTVYDFGDKRLFVIDEPHVLSQEECLAILKPGPELTSRLFKFGASKDLQR
jgi:hypothetical protein